MPEDEEFKWEKLGIWPDHHVVFADDQPQGFIIDGLDEGFQLRAEWIEPLATVDEVQSYLARKMQAWEDNFWDNVFHGENSGEPRGILNDGVNRRTGNHTSGFAYDEHRRVERTQTSTSTDDRSMAVSRAIHRWSRSVGVYRDRCDDLLLAQLLMEGLGTSTRT